MIETWLLEIMRCPRCHETLTEDTQDPALVCDGCGHRYAIVDGVPNMVVEE